jgi:uncharacterized protein (UPF0548 family)
VWSLVRPSASSLDAVLARVADQSVTYGVDEIGLSAREKPPAGYVREHHEAELEVPFASAREALARFATHGLSYLFVHPGGRRVELGKDVVVSARIGPLWSINPCRIVSVDETPDRFRYAYGTLPGHSESGEESFTVERTANGRVRAETIAIARPLDPLARLGSPIAHIVQRRIKIDYMRALREACTFEKGH